MPFFLFVIFSFGLMSWVVALFHLVFSVNRVDYLVLLAVGSYGLYRLLVQTKE